MFNGKFNVKMKKLRYIALALLAFGFVACEDQFVEEPNNPSNPEVTYQQIPITLDASKGISRADVDTRVYVGQVGSSGVTYHWVKTDTGSDSIGIYALNSTSTMKNYKATINKLMDNKNFARFSSYIEDNTANKNGYGLFIYWPYNKDNQTDATSTINFLKNTGVLVRTQAQQTQYGYNATIGAVDHPSMSNINNYGAAYDFVQTDPDGTGSFELQHQTAYLQFMVYGGGKVKETDNDYTNGWTISEMHVELGKVNGSVSDGLLVNDENTTSTFTPVNIAGNYYYGLPSSYTYNASNPAVGADKVEVKTSGEHSYVSVKLDEAQPLSGTTKVPVFAVVNAANLTTANVNAIKAVATLVKADGSLQVTRTRYINLGNIDINGGDYYTISYKVSDPVEASSALDAKENSNCYIVSYPGTYTFNANMPGNGKVPYKLTNPGFTLTNGKFFDPNTDKNYKLTWLWASGTTFDAVKATHSNYTDTQVVESILTECKLEGETGRMQLQLAQTDGLSGNIVLALYNDYDGDGKFDNDTNEYIVWSWHIWLTQAQDQYFKFEFARDKDGINGYQITNQNWYIMDRNLGAETTELGNPRSFGLYYQLNRKDPFIGPNGVGSQSGTEYDWSNDAIPTYRNTAVFGSTIASWTAGKSFSYGTHFKYPMHLTSKYNFSYGWVTTNDEAASDTKGYYDPCPAGYKLPTTREWDNFKDSNWAYGVPATISWGPFGYSINKAVEWDWTSEYYEESKKVREALETRIANGDYYEVNERRERTYTITAYSGTGEAITTTFPHSGVLTSNGQFNYVGNNFALWSSGRVEANSFWNVWYGIGSDEGWKDGYTAPYDNSDFNNKWIVYQPDNITNYNKNTSAAPTRCIKSYND